jgi:2-hydroxychromene-2-carboxylate isomerase
MERVGFWFDPLCGWSWMASRWVVDVARQRPLELTWHPVCLALLHEDPAAAPTRLDELSRRFARAAAAVRRDHGPERTGGFYTELGRRVHGPDGLFAPVRQAADAELTAAREAALGAAGPVVADALAAAGLPRATAAAIDDPSWDDVLRAAQETVPSGPYERRLAGVPMIAVGDEPAVFGPVLGAPPAGDQAARLWDAFRVLAGQDGFFELRRTVHRPPIRTYLG